MATRAVNAGTRGAQVNWRATLRRAARRAAEIGGAGLLLAGMVFLALALVSYHQTDPSGSTAAGGPPANWMGAPGAWAAERALFLFGPVSVLFLPLLYVGARKLWRLVEEEDADLPHADHAWWRPIGVLLFAMALLGTVLALVFTGPGGSLPAGMGGISGLLGARTIEALAGLLRTLSDTLAAWLLDSDVQYALAALFTLALLYLIGLLASFVVGKKLIATVEYWVSRLPLVQTIYGATKRFLQTVSQPPIKGQRVVLISFPSPEMKALGLITKVMRDADSGQELAVVYVPTSPNPTSGYIEILPLADVVMTDWTMEQAMSFVMTGGTNAPESVRFNNPPHAVVEAPLR